MKRYLTVLASLGLSILIVLTLWSHYRSTDQANSIRPRRLTGQEIVERLRLNQTLRIALVRSGRETPEEPFIDVEFTGPPVEELVGLILTHGETQPEETYASQYSYEYKLAFIREDGSQVWALYDPDRSMVAFPEFVFWPDVDLAKLARDRRFSPPYFQFVVALTDDSVLRGAAGELERRKKLHLTPKEGTGATKPLRTGAGVLQARRPQ